MTIYQMYHAELLDGHSNKITIMPTDNDYSQSCTLEMREQALYEARRGLLSSSLESLRSCVNKNEILQNHRSFDKYPSGFSSFFSIFLFFLANFPV